MQLSNQDWKKKLTEAQYKILREAGTERPFTGEYNLHFEDGVYTCAGCGTPLFKSETKFESGCGWPSFDQAIEGKIEYKQDRSLGMMRTEIRCATCEGHLGHVFDDGPTTTQKRYCVNSLSLQFNPKKNES